MSQRETICGNWMCSVAVSMAILTASSGIAQAQLGRAIEQANRAVAGAEAASGKVGTEETPARERNPADPAEAKAPGVKAASPTPGEAKVTAARATPMKPETVERASMDAAEQSRPIAATTDPIVVSTVEKAATPVAAASAVPDAMPIAFEQQTLPNGLRVIYAPLKNAPVVHVRVLYHVGSRDERPDRQGFAHLFEHMMFRGSEHVAPEEHMKLIGDVGGNCNAFTSFDQTVYVNTLPSSHLRTALWLEADRMSSFRVTDSIFETERNVVNEEYRMRRNRPYGDIFEKVFASVFTTHNYRWTPIGKMEQLAKAQAPELQAFFNRYYVPDNAVLVISGDFDTAQARKWVEEYFGWIPASAPLQRGIPKEPVQTEARRVEIVDRVPLPAVIIAFQRPPHDHPDADALDLLASILGGGSSTRLSRELVNSPSPLAMQAYVVNEGLQDSGLMAFGAIVLAGKPTAMVERTINQILQDVRTNGVTDEELEQVRRQALVGTIRGRETATDLAGELGTEALISGDAKRANTRLASLMAVTREDIQRVANTYLIPERSTTITVIAGPASDSPVDGPAASDPQDAPAVATEGRVKTFPGDYPTTPPQATISTGRAFEKGTETLVGGIRTIVMTDSRLPVVNFSLVIPSGSHRDPAGKEGLASMTAELISRGAGGDYVKWARDLESRGMSLSVSEEGDVTRINGSALATDLGSLIGNARQMLLTPSLDADEFARVKDQMLSGLKVQMEQPSTVATEQLSKMLYAPGVLGRTETLKSVGSITLDEVKAAYATTYQPDGALLVLAGDVSAQVGQEMAERLLGGWSAGLAAAAIDYTGAPEPQERQIVIIDNPSAKQATVMIGMPAYTIRSDEKLAGSIASRILSSGIDSRVMKYVRAEKGLAYSASSVFTPSRHAGQFVGRVDTSIPTARAAMDAMDTVLQKMRDENVTDEELADAKSEVAGSMLMQLQTIGQQAGFRVEGVLNDYPIDYYDTYPARIAQVTADDVRAVMDRYVKLNQSNVVIVGPAAEIQPQFEGAGEITVIPMPAARESDGGPAQPQP